MRALPVVALALLLSACAYPDRAGSGRVYTAPAKIDIRPDRIEISPDYPGPDSRPPHHCPPGHAKKGWC